MDIKLYKIYNPSSDKYSSGGYKPRWTTRGKTWNSLAAIKNHLRSALDRVLKPDSYSYYNKTSSEIIQDNKLAGFIYKDCVLKTYSDTTTVISPLTDVLKDMKCKGYKMDESQTILDRLIELYGKEWLV